MSFEAPLPSPEEDNHRLFISLTDREDYIKYADAVFTGGIAEWAEARTRLCGDFIFPRQVYLEWPLHGSDPHKVAWVEHFETEGGQESASVHHIICDCAGDFGEIQPQFCSIAENAVLERAADVSRGWRIPEILKAYEELDVTDYKRSEELNDILIKTMENILLTDNRHPEEWLGNIISGEHEIQLMGQILQQPEDTVRLCAEILEWQGKITQDGDTLRLAA